MIKFPPKEILENIEQHWQNLLLSRSVSPHLKDFMAGQNNSPTAPYYAYKGYRATVRFEEPLTAEKIKAINHANHWVNQGFVIRLYAYLEYCGVCSTIDTSMSGHNEIDILRRLRNRFAHTSGFYNPSDNEQKRLYERIITHFGLDQRNYPETDGLFPIPIDEVLAPLVDGCKTYVVAACSHQAHGTANTP